MDLSPGSLLSRWHRLTPPWQRAFALAWESFCAGDVGIGAVVVDPSGTVVTCGRTRRRDRSDAAGELAGNNLAHAEMNALVKLPTGWRGVEWLPELNPHVARRWPTRIGPAQGPLADWAALVAIAPTAERGTGGAVTDDYWKHLPELMSLASGSPTVVSCRNCASCRSSKGSRW